MATETIVAGLSEMLREEIPNGVRETLPETDPVFSQIKSSSMGVTSKGISRNWEVKHTLVTSLAGGFNWAANTAPVFINDTTNGPISPKFYDSLSSPFPTSTQIAQPGLVQTTIDLIKGVGNLMFPIQILMSNQMNAAILDYVTKSIQLSARLLTHYNALAFYKTNTALGTIGTVASAVGSNNYNWVLTITGRIRGFYPGMLVDLYDGAVLQNSTNAPWVVVDAVDYLNNTVTIRYSNGADISALAPSAGEVLVPRASTSGTAFYGPAGLDDYITDTGTVLGVSLTNYPQLKSLVHTANQSLDEDLLNKVFGAFEDAYGNLVKVDTLISSGGVVREYIAQATSLTYERNGTTLNFQGGFADFGYTYEGRKLKWMVSPYVAPNRLYGVKLAKGNWTRYVPPRAPKTGSDSRFGSEVQFMAQLGGGNGIFKHAHASGGGTTEFVEAPFVTFFENAPSYPQGFKITDLTEATL